MVCDRDPTYAASDPANNFLQAADAVNLPVGRFAAGIAAGFIIGTWVLTMMLPGLTTTSWTTTGELIFTYKGQPFSGVAYENVPGKWYSELTYRDGMQEGPAREWYPSGSLKGESYHHENARHGVSREFDESGRLLSEEVYEYAILVSRKFLDSSGRVTEGFEISPHDQLYPLLEHYRQSKGWPPVT